MKEADTGAPPSNMMAEVLRLLKPFWPVVATATLLGIVGGLTATGLLGRINQTLQRGELTPGFWLDFAGLLSVSVAGTSVAGILNSLVGQKIIASLRKDISSRILRAPLDAIERYRSHRLLATLNNDIDTVSAFTFNFSTYAIALAMALGGLVYLLWLSRTLFVFSVAFLATGMLLTAFSRHGWMKDYEGVRDAQDDLQKQYRAIIEGAKELRINQDRRARVFGIQLGGAVDAIARLKSHAMGRYWLMSGASTALLFIFIGIMLTARRQLGIDSADVSAAVIVLLFIKGPMEQLAGALPVMGQAFVSMKKLAALSAAFSNPEPDISLAPQEVGEPVLSMNSLALEQVGYTFLPDGGTGFSLGPVSLDIRAGEILFIVGKNGSGKTTLIKLLLGLYAPDRGRILYNGQPVTAAGRDAYRRLFTTVFADYYLFDEILVDPVRARESQRYLERLDLARKVRIQNGRFSTTDLSTGQRKRLALLQAYLEDRPVIVFDEWAADQDPVFRQVFYTELLPDLKRRGKTLIVISHDDRYFSAADRIIYMADGRIAK
ncbi:cyclic peptide export ABC transporter [Sodalis ligni]|uniref:Putative ATP-binding cassette transporter n=1 Tax=Sodalis ligni TaxID=2697027 RepID=A0A4R1N6Q9_9GAMM|nr:cyclic peptide export ABC transporter [Sodalis ligni]TCL02925.1 putative ATP-binding cassette transporter [Sodalis ligni]